MAQSISAGLSGAVGQPPSPNKPDDVLKVQKLLNGADAGLKEDGDCGRLTIGAIKDYQRNFLAVPDGRVDPGGITWKHLNERRLKVKRESLVLLPQECGFGYYSYASAERQSGTPACIQTLRDIAAQFRHNLPDVQIGIGDISFSRGGHMIPHQSHQHGTHVDIRPLRKDKERDGVTITSADYSREFTKLLVHALRTHRNVAGILFNDTAILGVKSHPGHHNHLHVSMRS